jgi:hypothetical protein
MARAPSGVAARSPTDATEQRRNRAAAQTPVRRRSVATAAGRAWAGPRRCPRYYVAVDHAMRAIVLAIRGTKRVRARPSHLYYYIRYTCIHTYMHTYIHTYICVCVCVYHTYRVGRRVEAAAAHCRSGEVARSPTRCATSCATTRRSRGWSRTRGSPRPRSRCVCACACTCVRACVRVGVRACACACVRVRAHGRAYTCVCGRPTIMKRVIYNNV